MFNDIFALIEYLHTQKKSQTSQTLHIELVYISKKKKFFLTPPNRMEKKKKKMNNSFKKNYIYRTIYVLLPNQFFFSLPPYEYMKCYYWAPWLTSHNILNKFKMKNEKNVFSIKINAIHKQPYWDLKRWLWIHFVVKWLYRFKYKKR